MAGELLALIGFAFVSSVTPGPNNLMLWASGTEFGFRRAVPHIVGTAVGLGIMALGVAAGLGALVTAVPAVSVGMKIAGSVYLLYLAWQVAGARGLNPSAVARPLTMTQAAAFQVVNVKAWIFAIGAMTTFRPADLPVAQGGLLVAAIMVVVILPTAGIWAAAGSTLGQVLAGGRRLRIVSLVLAGLLAATVVEVWV
jgi:threonine/homoserine/homoserine lactone efflux protein